MRTLLAPLCLVFALACAQEPATEADQAQATPSPTPESPAPKETPMPDAKPEDLVAALRTHVDEVAAREEHDADRVEVQHILIAFQGTGIPRVTRTQEEAEVLTAKVLAQIEAGGDFDALVKEHTNDSHPGIYGMVTQGQGDPRGQPPTMNRRGMVPAFGNVGWRLEVDQVGVAPFHPKDSPYGWHIVKRLK